jgi:hypothetical protein
MERCISLPEIGNDKSLTENIGLVNETARNARPLAENLKEIKLLQRLQMLQWG